MEIGKTLLFNTYSGNTLLRAQSATHNLQAEPETIPDKSGVLNTPIDTKDVHTAQSHETTANHNSSNNASTQSANADEKSAAKNDNETNEAQSTDKKEVSGTSHSNSQLSEEDLKKVLELKQRDMEVRTHEAAHLAAAGKYATGGASFDYKRGPDGRNYAVAGEVGIDTSPIANDPHATLQKAQQIRAAAQAPANPSSQDRQVAASAAQMEAKARQEIAALSLEKQASTNQADITEKNDEQTSNDADSINGDKISKTQSTTNYEPDDTNKMHNKNATSTYEAVDNIDQPKNDIASIIELVA